MKTIRIHGAQIADPSCKTLREDDLWIGINTATEKASVSRRPHGVFLAPSDVHGLEPDEEIDASGLVAAPGLVDLHVHLRDPGLTHKEDLASGCRAAAAGGITSLLAMPNTNPPMDDPALLRSFLTRASMMEVHVYQAAAATKGLFSDILNDLPALKAAGARAFSDDGFPVKTSALMREVLREAATLQIPVVSHCEDPTLMGGKINAGPVADALGLPGMPRAAEENGISRDIALAEALNTPLHICHVSTRGAVDMIRQAKARGVPVTAETAPHYFSLDEMLLYRQDADYRMNPPLRSKDDIEAVIDGICDGTLSVIATDHAPHAPSEKTDFTTAPNGSIGMETSLAVGITYLVRPGYLTLPQLIDRMSSAPAQILKIPAGRLSPGMPADLVLFDPNAQWTVDPSHFAGKSRNCPFKGMTLSGKVVMTLADGHVIYRAD